MTEEKFVYARSNTEAEVSREDRFHWPPQPMVTDHEFRDGPEQADEGCAMWIHPGPGKDSYICGLDWSVHARGKSF